MLRNLLCLCLSLFPLLSFAQWHQASGPDGDFAVSESGPTHWSVALDQNIKWKLTLLETGQSMPIVVGCKVFFSTLKPVEEDSTLEKDIIAWCCEAETGKVLWKREILGKYPLRMSGCFGDSSAPAPVCDGESVIFLNASGAMTSFDLAGNKLWSKQYLSVGRTMPFLHQGKYIYTRQVYPPDPNGSFPHKYKDSPKDMWTQLQALDVKTGEIVWTSECGVNMGMTTMPQTRKDGLEVAIVGRGGGHGPPEKPHGISMVNLENGKTLWTLPLDGFMATQSYRLYNGAVHIFHKGDHLSVDENTGKILKTVSIIKDIPTWRKMDGKRVLQNETLFIGKNRMITQGSNLLVGNYHYFRSYVRPWVGRVDVETGKVEYLELPLQISRKPDQLDELIWYKEPSGGKKAPGLTKQGVPNDMMNSRGLKVVGDKRSHGSGWGHIASPQMTVAGNHLYMPVMNGTVFVLGLNARQLDESAIVAINDLGPAGQSFTRASVSFSAGRAYAHTIRELICIADEL